MTTILGLDPSTTAVGYCLLELPGDTLVEYGVLRADREDTFDGRLATYAHYLDAIMARVTFDAVACEMPVLYRNPATTIKLAQVVGALRYVAHARTDTFIEVIPSQRHHAFGLPTRMKRNDSKRQIRKLVNLRYGLELTAREHDISDSIAVALAGWNKLWGAEL